MAEQHRCGGSPHPQLLPGHHQRIVGDDGVNTYAKPYLQNICAEYGADLEGKVYRAILPMYKIYQYCSNSFEQFFLICTKYLSMYHECDIESSEQREKSFRNYTQKIDPTALADEHNMWSVYAEKMGYGF